MDLILPGDTPNEGRIKINDNFTDLSNSITGLTEDYKVYTALLNQTGTNAPTAIVLKNTLGGTPTFLYYGIGEYSMKLVGAFTDGKSTVNINSGNFSSFTTAVTVFSANFYGDEDELYISSLDVKPAVPVGINDKLDKTFLEVRIYT